MGKSDQIDLTKIMMEEYQRAAAKFGERHNSPHEAYAVMKEEFEEAEEQINSHLRTIMRDYWSAVKKSKFDIENNKKLADKIKNSALSAAAELIQVAAMAHKASLGFVMVGKCENE